MARLLEPTTAAIRLGGSRFFLILFLAGWVHTAVADESGPAERVRALIQGGATQLALKLIDQYQPAPGDTRAWMAWEKQRLALYRAQRDWAQLAARVINHPQQLPDDFRRWARTEAARAELEAQRAEGARRFLRELLWSGEGSREEQAEWRQLVIRSYLLDDNVVDAHAALERYRADYRVDSPAWRLLEATILLRADRPKDAYLRVGAVKTHEGRLHALLAALRAEVLPAAAVVTRAMQLAEETRNKPVLQQQTWLVVSEAAARARDPLRRIHALERALTLARQHPAPERLLVARADDLWDAYRRYAEAVGNDKRLLVGKDGAWFRHAESYKRDDAMQARAFYAFLAGRASTAKYRDLATRRLADSLVEDGRGEVLRALYGASDRYPRLAAVPAYVRYRLAELALEGYDIAFAGQLMQGLETPPNGEDKDLWALRRARVLIYAGRYVEAHRLLDSMLNGRKKVADDLAEKLLQVIFDLQAARRHAEAVALLDRLMRKIDNRRTEREILYWTAESKAAEGEHQRAAELYLRSATYHHPTGGDMWGQTARFHAAESLGNAGLTHDARLVFEALLKHTADAKQRAVIERSIQQLWLIEKRTTTP
jgi:hypothetical protein